MKLRVAMPAWNEQCESPSAARDIRRDRGLNALRWLSSWTTEVLGTLGSRSSRRGPPLLSVRVGTAVPGMHSESAQAWRRGGNKHSREFRRPVSAPALTGATGVAPVRRPVPFQTRHQDSDGYSTAWEDQCKCVRLRAPSAGDWRQVSARQRPLSSVDAGLCWAELRASALSALPAVRVAMTELPSVPPAPSAARAQPVWNSSRGIRSLRTRPQYCQSRATAPDTAAEPKPVWQARRLVDARRGCRRGFRAVVAGRTRDSCTSGQSGVRYRFPGAGLSQTQRIRRFGSSAGIRQCCCLRERGDCVHREQPKEWAAHQVGNWSGATWRRGRG